MLIRVNWGNVGCYVTQLYILLHLFGLSVCFVRICVTRSTTTIEQKNLPIRRFVFCFVWLESAYAPESRSRCTPRWPQVNTPARCVIGRKRGFFYRANCAAESSHALKTHNQLRSPTFLVFARVRGGSNSEIQRDTVAGDKQV